MTAVAWPETVGVNLDAIPSWLTAIPHWVAWAWKQTPKGTKPFSKPPLKAFNPFNPAASNDPKTWTDFATASTFYRNHAGKTFRSPGYGFQLMKLGGIGVVLTKGEGVVGVDLDHARREDGQPEAWAAPLLKALLAAHAYVEVSPSGTGYRSFVRASLPGGLIRNNNAELYDSKQYLTVTGHLVEGSGTELVEGPEVTAAVMAIWERINPPAAGKQPPQLAALENGNTEFQGTAATEKIPAALSDSDLLSAARRASNAAAIFSLFDGGYPAGCDKSVEDQRLADLLAFYSGPDEGRLDSLMRQSALLADAERLKKWDAPHYAGGETYGQRTVRNAIRTHAGDYYKGRKDPAKEAPRTAPRTHGNGAGEGSPAKGKAPPKDPPGASLDGRPLILYGHNHPVLAVPHRATRCVSEVEAAMKDTLYVFAGNVVHLTSAPMDYHEKKRHHGVKRPAGMLTVTLADEKALYKLVDRATVGVRYNARTNEWLPCPPDMAVMSEVLAVDSETTLPQLTGLTACPLFILSDDRRSYRILNRHGYDAGTGLYCDVDPADFKGGGIDGKLAKKDLLAARSVLEDAVSEFPFKDDVAKAVAIAALLSPLVRPLLSTAPMVAVTAPVAGTGKTQLAMLVNIIATGTASPVILPYSFDPNEFKKEISTLLLGSSPVSVIDNVPSGAVFKHPFFELIMTSPTTTVRLFGTQRKADVSTVTQWIITGNNLAIAGDMNRRTILCSLDSGEERPQFRRFKRNLTDWAVSHRAQLVTAGLSVLAGYVQAGMPSWQGYVPLASFEDWSDLVRRATWWILSLDSELDEAGSVQRFDPVQSQRVIEAEDPQRQALETVIDCWLAHYGAKETTAPELAALTVQSTLDSPEVRALGEALKAAVPHKGDAVSSAAMGFWLRSLKDRVINGVKVVTLGRGKAGMRWKLERPK